MAQKISKMHKCGPMDFGALQEGLTRSARTETPRKVDRNRSDQEAAAARGGKRRPCVRFVEEGAVACAMEARVKWCNECAILGSRLCIGVMGLNRPIGPGAGPVQRMNIRFICITVVSSSDRSTQFSKLNIMMENNFSDYLVQNDSFAPQQREIAI
ncbi:hypothetical protein F511_36915 [Dorcoceras hygrometricum]|uniref:Uncharacterized protein n=1 Tax=Dorcoceras hygrometricum TaxID=472368 RepID=A0A2Z7CEU1_9LAMI|nr:hypothetical protein F511_36915 [Dorcoceras hygrometricum]